MVDPGHSKMNRLFIFLVSLCLFLSGLEASDASSDFSIKVCEVFDKNIERHILADAQRSSASSALVRIFHDFGADLKEYFSGTGEISFEECHFEILVENFLMPKLNAFKSQHPDYAAEHQEALIKTTKDLLEEGFNSYADAKENIPPPASEEKIFDKFGVFPTDFMQKLDATWTEFGSDILSAPSFSFLNDDAPSATFACSDLAFTGFPQPSGSSPFLIAPPISSEPFLQPFAPFKLPQQTTLSFPENVDFSSIPVPRQPLTTVPAPLPSNGPAWSIDSFLDELNNRLDSEFLPVDDFVCCYPTLHEILSRLSETLIIAAANNDFDFKETQEVILKQLQNFFVNQTIVPLRQMMQGSNDDGLFQEMLEVLYNKNCHFSKLCEEALQKHYSVPVVQPSFEVTDDDREQFSCLQDEEDYTRLAVRIGIDIHKPEELLHAKSVPKLAALGIDIGDPEFQNFVNQMIVFYAGTEQSDDVDVEGSNVFLNAPQPSRPAHKYSFKNAKVAKKLKVLLSTPEFTAQLKQILRQAVEISELAEAYLEIVTGALRKFVSGPEFYNAIPPGALEPPQANISVAAALNKACLDFDLEMLGCESFGPEVAKRVSAWLSSTLFADEFKSAAVAKWNQSHSLSTSPESLASLSNSGRERKASFGADQVKEFAWLSSPEALSSDEASAAPPSGLTFSSTEVPPFPYKNPEAALTVPEYMRYTRDYVLQHGDSEKFQLKRRLGTIARALPAHLESAFADADEVTRQQILATYQSILL